MTLLQRTICGIKHQIPWWIHKPCPYARSPNHNPLIQKVWRNRCYVLGIESSCDDTGLAIVNNNGEILAEALATQNDIHAEWGGVVPRLAQEAHLKVIDHLLTSITKQFDLNLLSAVAVTVGPGLSLCLKVGVEKAMNLSSMLSIPLIPVHHMEAHALVGRMTHDVQFPFVCLLVSGGHNLLLVVHDLGIYTQIGTTLDDSLGEVYDKVARMLNLELQPSGGAAVEKIAKNGDPHKYPFKLPMQKYNYCDFSYSGLKTSVRITIEKEFENKTIPDHAKADLAASFQKTATDHLCNKVSRGLKWAHENISNLNDQFIVSGGVASNAYVKGRLSSTIKALGFTLLCPAPRLCTDNGVMVAWTGMERFQLGLFDSNPASVREGDQWIDLRARWPLTDRRAFPVENGRIRKRKRLHTSLTTLTEQRLSRLTTLAIENPDT